MLAKHHFPKIGKKPPHNVALLKECYGACLISTLTCHPKPHKRRLYEVLGIVARQGSIIAGGRRARRLP